MVGYAVSAYPHACLKKKKLDWKFDAITSGKAWQESHALPDRDHLAEKE
jgi:hypothetical protein